MIPYTTHSQVENIVSKMMNGNASSQLTEELTWAKLKELRDASKLVPGMRYRITDYSTATAQENTISACHDFDIIVTADTESTLNEDAKATLHDGDEYFSSKGANLSAWKLRYKLDNDTEHYAWADAENGKGVIIYLKDEWGNECLYDFKNIKYLGSSLYKFTEHLGDLLVDTDYYFTFHHPVHGDYSLCNGDAFGEIDNCAHNSILAIDEATNDVICKLPFVSLIAAADATDDIVDNIFSNKVHHVVTYGPCYNNVLLNFVQNIFMKGKVAYNTLSDSVTNIVLKSDNMTKQVARNTIVGGIDNVSLIATNDAVQYNTIEDSCYDISLKSTTSYIDSNTFSRSVNAVNIESSKYISQNRFDGYVYNLNLKSSTSYITRNTFKQWAHTININLSGQMIDNEVSNNSDNITVTAKALAYSTFALQTKSITINNGTANNALAINLKMCTYLSLTNVGYLSFYALSGKSKTELLSVLPTPSDINIASVQKVYDVTDNSKGILSYLDSKMNRHSWIFNNSSKTWSQETISHEITEEYEDIVLNAESTEYGYVIKNSDGEILSSLAIAALVARESKRDIKVIKDGRVMTPMVVTDARFSNSAIIGAVSLLQREPSILKDVNEFPAYFEFEWLMPQDASSPETEPTEEQINNFVQGNMSLPTPDMHGNYNSGDADDWMHVINKRTLNNIVRIDWTTDPGENEEIAIPNQNWLNTTTGELFVCTQYTMYNADGEETADINYAKRIVAKEWRKVGGGGENHLYRHTMQYTLYPVGDYARHPSIEVMTSDATPFTNATFTKWLYDNGFNAKASYYKSNETMIDYSSGSSGKNYVYIIHGYYASSETDLRVITSYLSPSDGARGIENDGSASLQSMTDKVSQVF